MRKIRNSSSSSLLKRWNRNVSLLLKAIRTRLRLKEAKEKILKRVFRHLDSKIKLKFKKKSSTRFLKKQSMRKQEIR